LFPAGWYVVWQLFLSKFKFLRELIGDTGSQQGDNETSETEAEQETPPTLTTERQTEICSAAKSTCRRNNLKYSLELLAN